VSKLWCTEIILEDSYWNRRYIYCVQSFSIYTKLSWFLGTYHVGSNRLVVYVWDCSVGIASNFVLVTVWLKRNPSWEADRSCSSQEISLIVWSINFISVFARTHYYSVYLETELAILFFQIYFNIIFPYTPMFLRVFYPPGLCVICHTILSDSPVCFYPPLTRSCLSINGILILQKQSTFTYFS
jgi:hypothetical protein